MKKAEKEELDQLFQSIIHLFGGVCFTCKEPYTNKIAFTVHHVEYKEDEKEYGDFRLPDKTLDRLNYYRYLVPLIQSQPERAIITEEDLQTKRYGLMLLHHKHHWMCESWARLKPANFERTVLVARQINQTRKNGAHRK